MDWDDSNISSTNSLRKYFPRLALTYASRVASRDRGVDAIIYDPDPIRGGRYIIQAKKYTNRVDVAAVRDLFGTVQAEKANRGILVTTSHFGPDAHEFAKDKNITLIEGPELLHLFEKHGYKFRIDIAEARRVMGLA
jgi:restriction system protein